MTYSTGSAVGSIVRYCSARGAAVCEAARGLLPKQSEVCGSHSWVILVGHLQLHVTVVLTSFLCKRRPPGHYDTLSTCSSTVSSTVLLTDAKWSQRQLKFVCQAVSCSDWKTCVKTLVWGGQNLLKAGSLHVGQFWQRIVHPFCRSNEHHSCSADRLGAVCCIQGYGAGQHRGGILLSQSCQQQYFVHNEEIRSFWM